MFASKVPIMSQVPNVLPIAEPAISALTIADIGQPLSQTTFVVVDLETAGGKPVDAGITEIGAVKVRGGEVVGEFRTFCAPGVPIPAFISVLTGITDHHVADAPSVATAVREFLAFAGFDSGDNPVLVAHNSPFDVGFLKAACIKFDINWPKPPVLDTVVLARKILRKDEVRNRKLATLANYFRAPVSPTHRALDDARATVSVLHGLIERVGNLGVHDLEGLQTFNGPATEKRRRKRYLADGLPELPGVYIFYDGNNRPLYVGTSTSIRKRVMSYFTAAETRPRMTSMVELAQRVDAHVCATSLEAAIRELRMINELRPTYNFRSRNPEKTTWVTMTDERFPRLSLSRQSTLPDSQRVAIGPFTNGSSAELAMHAIYQVTDLRQCKERITSKTSISPCVLYEMKRCIAPCLTGGETVGYENIVSDVNYILKGDSSSASSKLMGRIQDLVSDEKFEDAAVIRDRMHALEDGVHRSSRLRQITSIPLVIAAELNALGGWDIHAISHGRFAAGIVAPPGEDPKPFVLKLKSMIPSDIGLPTLVSEIELVLKWLGNGVTRLVEISDGHTWLHPIHAKVRANELISS
ncbi:MAG: DEDD exnuclease domain-containing protein [Actinobacteria bacterium]|nr:DEDD exnuclease domain-containing protein [Actinomycetota bacterium]